MSTPTRADIASYNRRAWDREVASGNRWTVPVGPEVLEAARRGGWELVLTPTRPVPRAWFGELRGARVLCLASGGGQQGPVLAAAGAEVTVFDNSAAQLGQDAAVATREGLAMTLVQGDMRDLGALGDGAFDLVFHPVSNCFIPDVRPVWAEVHRVLRPGGALLAGFANPAGLIFDEGAKARGELVVRHRIPYSDLEQLTAEELQAYVDKEEPLMFGHTLEDLIGGQLEAGLVLAGFFEDVDPGSPLQAHLPTYIATRAVRLP